MTRLALLPIETDPDDERLCSVGCHLLDVTTGGEWSCLGFADDESGEATALDGYQATAVRCAPCLSATRLADAQSGAIQAAVAWANGRIDDDKTTVALINAVRAVIAEQRKEGPGDG